MGLESVGRHATSANKVNRDAVQGANPFSSRSLSRLRESVRERANALRAQAAIAARPATNSSRADK